MRIAMILLAVAVVGLGALAARRSANAPRPIHSTEALQGNPVVFWELASHDAETSVRFFEQVFGWEIAQAPGTILYEVSSRTDEGGISGGIFTLRQAKLPFLTVYILVDDIEEKARIIEESGGLIIEPPHVISSGSWICLFNDPSGVTFAMLQPASGGG